MCHQKEMTVAKKIVPLIQTTKKHKGARMGKSYGRFDKNIHKLKPGQCLFGVSTLELQEKKKACKQLLVRNTGPIRIKY
jgi:ribosomal protein L16/L10AE